MEMPAKYRVWHIQYRSATPVITSANRATFTVGQRSASASVTPLNVAFALYSNTGLAAFGAPLTLRASVSGIAATGTATFTVLTNRGQVTLPGFIAVPLVAGSAGCTVPSAYQTRSPRLYLAAYSGDANNAQATASLSQAVGANAAVLTVAAYTLSPIVAGRTGTGYEQTRFDLRIVAQGPLDYTDMWWAGSAENGWGVSVTQHGPIQFNVIFAYDAQGKTVWYVMPGGSFDAAGTAFSGAL